MHGKSGDVVLHEPEGADVLVSVLSPRQQPIPFVQVEVGAWPWVDLDDEGVQRLDPFVDERGERLLRRLPTDREIRLKALWLGLTATARLRLEEGERREVVLTLE